MADKLKLDLDNLAEGEAQERISHKLEKIAKNIMDTMTEPTKKRALTVQIEYVPNEQRTALETSVLVKSSLAPYRTFLEVEQPESDFVLRVNKEAKLALFEADGGFWKLEAVRLVKEYLSDNLKDFENVFVLA